MSTTIDLEEYAFSKISAFFGTSTFIGVMIALIAFPDNGTEIGYWCLASFVMNGFNALSAKARSTGLAGPFTAVSFISLFGVVTLLAPQIASLLPVQ